MRTPLDRLVSLLAAAEAAGGDIDADDAARLLGVRVDRLERELDAITAFGVDPFGPGDYLEVELDDDRVVLHLGMGLERPVRLAPLDSALLLRCVAAIRPQLTAAASTATALCERLKTTDPPVAWSSEAGPTEGLVDRLRAACRTSQELRLRYHNASRDLVQERVVEPGAVLQHKGRWYLVAWVPDGRRNFRLDRILAAETTGRTVATDRDLGARRPVLFDRAPNDAWVRVRVPPSRRAAAIRRLGGGGRDLEEEGDVLLVRGPTLPTLLRALLAFGHDWELLGPDEARSTLRTWLERGLD